MSLTNDDLEQLAILARMPEGSVVVGLLRKRLVEHHAMLLVASGEDVIRVQGRCQAVQQLIDDIELAKARLQRSIGSQRPRAYATPG